MLYMLTDYYEVNIIGIPLGIDESVSNCIFNFYIFTLDCSRVLLVCELLCMGNCLDAVRLREKRIYKPAMAYRTSIFLNLNGN